MSILVDSNTRLVVQGHCGLKAAASIGRRCESQAPDCMPRPLGRGRIELTGREGEDRTAA
jgi:hypothetical protein